MKNRKLAYARALVTGSFLCSMGLILILMIRESRLAVVLLGFGLITVASRSLMATLQRNNKPYEWFISLAMLNLVLVVPELGLRAVDFSYESRAEFRYPRTSNYMYFEPDEKLFWKLKSSYSNVNSLGFIGPEVATPKPKGVFRILFLGDSVTQQGYPGFVQQFLNAIHIDGDRRIEAVNLSVVGYSSYQGTVVAEMYGAKFEPDLAVVFFGWNDHWQAFGTTDSDKKVVVSHSVLNKITGFAYHHSLILQAFHMLRDSFGDYSAPTGSERVPPEQYRDNLHRIGLIFEKQKVPVVYITAPTSHYTLGVPDYLVEKGFVRDKQSAIDLHKSYNQIVRRVSSGDNALLLDLETEFMTIPPENLQALFLKDGIHFTNVGIAYMAKRVTDFIEQNVALAN